MWWVLYHYHHLRSPESPANLYSHHTIVQVGVLRNFNLFPQWALNDLELEPQLLPLPLLSQRKRGLARRAA